jgi:glycosyltransferase involved in cell wall biosynthesis
MKVVVVAENVSLKMSGEALLAYQFIRFMKRRGIDVSLVCHERVKPEMATLWDSEERIDTHFVRETMLQTVMWRSTQWLPYRIRDLIINHLLHLLTQIQARKIVKKLTADVGADVVFEPAPIAPKGISCMYDVGAPVVIGPMCGGLEFPPGFRFMDSAFSRLAVNVGRFTSEILHRVFPGKRNADALIVANCCTRDALPKGCRGKIYHVVESGVDVTHWDNDAVVKSRDKSSPVRFLYIGRLVDWKGVEYLIEAFARVPRSVDAVLEVVGDGELMPRARKLVSDHGLASRVNLHGWVQRSELPKLMRSCDCMVVPSLRECGGNAMLEAMSMGMPLIGTAWAGPKNYISPECGMLVDPGSPETFVEGLAKAMVEMASDSELRHKMGDAAQQRVRENFFDWDSKANRIIAILEETVQLRKLAEVKSHGQQSRRDVLEPEPATV